jgi:hypothetical protein
MTHIFFKRMWVFFFESLLAAHSAETVVRFFRHPERATFLPSWQKGMEILNLSQSSKSFVLNARTAFR